MGLSFDYRRGYRDAMAEARGAWEVCRMVWQMGCYIMFQDIWDRLKQEIENETPGS